MKIVKSILTLTLTLMASTSWSADFIDPRDYKPSQKAELILFAHQLASKQYVLNNDDVVDYMTEKMVNACLWLSEYADDREILDKVVDTWKDDGGDYIMMKYDYQQALLEDEQQFVDGYLF